jgi:hypothetical protein
MARSIASFGDITIVVALALAISLSGCGRSDPAPRSSPAPVTPAPESPAPPGSPVQIEMKNVHLHAADGVVMEIASLRGEMLTTAAGQPPVFDDTGSYVLDVRTADIAMPMSSLETLMNSRIFGGDDAELSDVSLEIDEGQLKMKGTLHKGVPVKFSSKATVSAASGGRLRVHTESFKAFGIPIGGLLDLFKLDLEDLASLEGARGVVASDDDILLTPGQALPPPVIRGHLARAWLANGRLHLRYSPADGPPPPQLSPPKPAASGYVYFSGASIRFGRLTMTGSHLQLIDADPRDPFDFFPERYERQLIAGYSKNRPDGGLETYMPDYDDLRRGTDLRPH